MLTSGRAKGLSRDDRFFVRGNDSHRTRARLRADDRARDLVSSLVEQDAEVLQAVRDESANGGCVLADAPREDERVEASQHRGEGAYRLSHVVAKKGDGLARARVARLAGEQIA